MRDELHVMELVDRYLDGSMNAEERTALEARANSNAELRQLIEDQRALREGLARVPVRASVAKAYHAYRFGKPGPWIGGAVLVAVVITATLFMQREGPIFGTRTHDPVVSVTSLVATDTLDEAITASFATEFSDTTGTHIAPLVMLIDPNADTTLLTPNGVLLDVPRGIFVDADGRQVTTPVRITMLEAFDAATIMRAGLSTMSGKTLLETGGMFYIDAFSNGTSVSIASGKTVNVMVPADGAKPGMMLYEGVMGSDSIIDWRNPVELPRTLVPVDITTLDFYPPGYEAKLAALGLNVRSKTFKDSLYYSFVCSTEKAQWSSQQVIEDEPAFPDSIRAGVDTAAYSLTSFNRSTTGACGIAPSKIKAIWQTKFNGTNLATREFEERMRSIHATCDNAVLDLYVNHLDDELRTLDRRVAQRGYPAFNAFADRNDGRVALPAGSAERLKNIYAEWSRSYAEAARSAQDAFWKKQAELDGKLQKRRQASAEAEQNAWAQVLKEEMQANLRSVYAQLGYTVQPEMWAPRTAMAARTATVAPTFTVQVRTTALPRPPRAAFNAQVRRLGWCNIDQVAKAASTRESLIVSDGGKKQATVTYAPCAVTIPEASTYDALRVYLLPQGTSGYQRMRAMASDRYTENLNALYTYDLVVLAQIGDRSWLFERNDINGATTLTASLEPIDQEQLTKRLMRYERNRGADLLDAAKTMELLAKDAPRQRANMDRIRLREAIRPTVFPCATVNKATITDEATTAPLATEGFGRVVLDVLADLDTKPEFIGGDEALQRYLISNLKYPAEAEARGIQGRVTVSFIVTDDGSIRQPVVVTGIGGGCDEVALQVIRRMPKWKPGTLQGRQVGVRMSLPIVFRTRE